MSDRCYGGCCRRIWLPYQTRAEIAASGAPDAKQISEMLEPEADQFAAQDGLPISLNRGLLFRCTNLLESGDCGIYEKRPAMCRDFPNGYQCPVPACESASAKALPIHPNRPSRAKRREFAASGKKDRRKPSPALSLWNAAEDAARAREPGAAPLGWFAWLRSKFKFIGRA